MTLRIWIILLIVMSFSLIAGCGKKKERVVIYKEGPAPTEYRDIDEDDYEYDDDDYDDDDVKVRVEHRHVCSHGCADHFYNGSRVVILRNHRHGPGCGHIFNDRYWVRARPRRVVRTQHVCSRACNHYWNGSRLIDVRGHRHGPGCGHNWGGSYWIVGDVRGRPRSVTRVPARHVCTQGCHHHYWNGSRLIDVRGHRHGPGCGHQWNGSYWIVGGSRGGTTVIPKRGRRIR